MANVVTNASCQCVGTDSDDRRRRDADGDDDGDRVDATAADGREALQEVVAQRQGLAPQEHPQDDHGERQRAGHARVVDVAGQLGLADADRHAGGEGDRERPEAGDERGGQRRQHEVGHVGDLQLARSGRSGWRRRRPAPSRAPSWRWRSGRATARRRTPPAGSRPPPWWPCRTWCSGTAATARR